MHITSTNTWAETVCSHFQPTVEYLTLWSMGFSCAAMVCCPIYFTITRASLEVKIQKLNISRYAWFRHQTCNCNLGSCVLVGAMAFASQPSEYFFTTPYLTVSVKIVSLKPWKAAVPPHCLEWNLGVSFIHRLELRYRWDPAKLSPCFLLLWGWGLQVCSEPQ